MFNYFKQWSTALWAWGGAILIASSLWYQVQVNVKINEWFGTFYDLIQKALSAPGSITPDQYWDQMWSFGTIAGIFIVVAVLTDYFTQHWVFRWRQSMDEFYVSHWSKLHSIEGASQRVQEDCKRFAVLVETLGVNFVRATMTLIAFVPILWNLSKGIDFYGINHSLVIGAIGFALFGTVLLAILGYKLPGLEYQNQVVEAAYRKHLVHSEDDPRGTAALRRPLFDNLRRNYFRLYFHYMYFGVGKWSYLQFGVLVPYIILGPSVIGGLITFGVMQQTVRAFNQVEKSLQYLVENWTTVVELLSVRKRLKEFEENLT